jgi:hypothetical protein
MCLDRRNRREANNRAMDATVSEVARIFAGHFCQKFSATTY